MLKVTVVAMVVLTTAVLLLLVVVVVMDNGHGDTSVAEVGEKLLEFSGELVSI